MAKERIKYLQENINELINRLNGLSNNRNLLVDEIKKNKDEIKRLYNENNISKGLIEKKKESKEHYLCDEKIVKDVKFIVKI